MVWISGVSLALEEFSNLDHLPNRILLCGGGSSLQLIQDELEQANWYKELPFSKNLKYNSLCPAKLVELQMQPI